MDIGLLCLGINGQGVKLIILQNVCRYAFTPPYVRITEELLGRKSSGPAIENRD
jgi:hypothetical protein